MSSKVIGYNITEPSTFTQTVGKNRHLVSAWLTFGSLKCPVWPQLLCRLSKWFPKHHSWPAGRSFSLSVFALFPGPLTSVCYFSLQVLLMKGKLLQDLRAGAPCPPPLLHPQFLPASAQFCECSFWALSRDWCLVQSNGAEIFFQDGAGVM